MRWLQTEQLSSITVIKIIYHISDILAKFCINNLKLEYLLEYDKNYSRHIVFFNSDEPPLSIISTNTAMEKAAISG